MFLARNHFFVDSLKTNCYHHDGTPKRQPFRVAHVAEQAPGALQETIFGPKIAQKTDFLRYTPVTHLSWAQAEPTQWDHNIPISLGQSGYLCFPVGAHSAARKAVVWPQLPKITIFGSKIHIMTLYCMASYDTAWN